jgi:hypothetical protein
MTKAEFYEFFENFTSSMIEISKAKNADYTAGDADPFENFKKADPDWTPIGFFTRMTDKMQRIKAFIKKGTLAVKEESVTDSLKDLANYCILFAGYLEDEKRKKHHYPLTIEESISPEELMEYMRSIQDEPPGPSEKDIPPDEER